jgi:hypothetical protein
MISTLPCGELKIPSFQNSKTAGVPTRIELLNYELKYRQRFIKKARTNYTLGFLVYMAAKYNQPIKNSCSGILNHRYKTPWPFIETSA